MGKADKIKKGLRMICAYPMRISNGISFRATVVDSDIHKSSKIMYGSNVRYSTVGKNTYLGRNVFAAHTDIGAFCSIANGVVIGGGSHNLKAVSTSPLFEANHNIFGKNFADISFDPHKKTKIGNDVWIGTNAIILQGVTVSDGAVVGAGAVVTKDVEPYTIVAGCPARPIKRRFSDDVIENLLQSCWWEIDDDNIRKLGKYFDDPDEFLKQLKKLKEQN